VSKYSAQKWFGLLFNGQLGAYLKKSVPFFVTERQVYTNLYK